MAKEVLEVFFSKITAMEWYMGEMEQQYISQNILYEEALALNG